MTGVALALLALAGCSQATTGPAGPMPTGTTPAATPAPTPAEAAAAAEFERLYRARQDSARMRFTEADVRFMQNMIGHHAQALVMAGMAPKNGASPTIQTLAARIINAQKDEIALMQRWLRDRGQTVPEVHIEGNTLMLHNAGEHAHHMPGMLTEEQLKQLEGTRGAAFDRLFLELMIKHHQGAVSMVAELFATDGALQDEEAFKFASDVQVDQTTEVDRMQRMLDAMGGA